MILNIQLAIVAWVALQSKVVEAADPLHPPVLPIDEQTGDSIDLSSLQQQRDCMNCYCLNYMNGYSIQGTVCAAYCFAVSDPTSCEFGDLVKLDEQLESLAHDDAQGTIIKRTSYLGSSVMNLREGFLQVCKDIKSHIASNGACPRNINSFVGKYATAPTKKPTLMPTKAPTKKPTVNPTKYPTPSPTKSPLQPCKSILTGCIDVNYIDPPYCTNSGYPVQCGATQSNCGLAPSGDPRIRFKCCNRSGC